MNLPHLVCDIYKSNKKFKFNTFLVHAVHSHDTIILFVILITMVETWKFSIGDLVFKPQRCGAFNTMLRKLT